MSRSAAHAQRIKGEGARHLMSEEDKRAERTQALRAQAAKAVREMERRSQAAADRMITRDLDREALPQG